MKVVTARKEGGLYCHLCNETIEKGSPCFSKWNTRKLRFSHLICQYKSKPRKHPLKEWLIYLEGQRHLREIGKKNLTLKQLIENH